MKKLKINFKYFAYFALLIVGIVMPTSIHAATGDSYAHAELINVPSTTSVSFDFGWSSRRSSGRYYDYKFTAPSTGSVHIYSTGANTDTDLDIYNSSFAYLTGDTSGNNNVDITFNVTQGSTYILDLYNYNRYNYGNFTLHIEMGTPSPSGTTWVKNAAGTSAHTDPTPYTDNVDITETLTSTTSSTTVNVTVSGNTEADYDYIYITDGANNTVQYSGSINATYEAVGPSVTIHFTSDRNTRPANGGVTVSITDVIVATEANDDSYTTPIDTPLATENVLDNDTGTGISVQSNTSPSHGSVTIQADGTFVYTPTLGFTGSDSFDYTITDGTSTSTATVTISVTNSTDFKSGVQPFVLINPTSTRNVIGNYAILGNTIECITDKLGTSRERNSYNGACQSSNRYNDNNYMSKYLDIDGDSGIGASTWNSSSSNFTLPSNYDQQGGNGILWAGIFWQGSINNEQSYKQRRASLDGNGNITYKYITSDENIDLEQTNGNKLLLRIDGDAAYTPIQARTFYYDNAHGDHGGYYAAYRDITQILRDRNLAAGDHTITVANLTTNEGRQQGTGNYGGWSIVVIYREDDLNGAPRNISIYNGYTVIPNSRQVEISGFKLPSSGTVRAKFSSFAGEGEYIYGSSTSSYDRMVMKRLPGDTGDNMPGATDPNNIFDAILANISRDSGNDNDILNANGIDIDDYNVSSIITGYRNTDPTIDKVYIALSSNSDYVTPSMMAFSTELYKPKLCYDYTYDIGGYVLTSENNEISTAYHRFNPTLTTHVSIKSKEADFSLHNVTFTAKSDTEYMWYQTGSTYIAPNLIHGYDHAPSYNEIEVDPINAPGLIESFTMDIGDSITSGSGGTVNPNETTYLRFKHDMNTSQPHISTSLDMKVNFTVDYGSGPVPQAQALDADAICEGGTAGVYRPVYGKFDIVSGGATSHDCTSANPSLLTQVSGRPYDITACGYEESGGYVNQQAFDTAVEVEIYNVNYYVNQPSLSCYEPDANITTPFFLDFSNTDNVSTPQVFNVAQRNAAYRVWYIKKADGSIALNHITSRDDTTHISELYNNNPSDYASCSSECPGGRACYKCLRKYYGKPVCSRDNFSIRPEGFSIQLNDGADEITKNTTTTRQSIAGGYDYNITVKATAYGTDLPAGRYVKGFADGYPSSVTATSPGNYDGATMVNGFSTNTDCTDITSEDFAFTFWEGSADNDEVKLRNAGEYSFRMLDSTWTAVDQGNGGCVVGASNVPTSGIVGCNTSSIYGYTGTGTGQHYDISLLSLPYKFDMTDISYATQATSNNYVYSNTLGVPPSTTIDNNMSVSFSGDIEAQGADNSAMTNFTTGCYAKDVRLTYGHTTVPASPTTVGGTPLTLRWYEKTASDDTTTTPVGTSDLVSTVAGPKLLAANFSKLKQGKSQVDLRVNYDRQSNAPHNPFKLTSTALDADCNVLANCTMNAEGVNTYTPNSTQNSRKTFDKNTTVLYSRVNAPRKMVMCTNASGSCAGSVDYYYEFYANQAAEKDAATRALITAILPDATRKRSLDSVNWYRNTNHTAVEGKVTNPSTSAVLIEGSSSFNNGVQSINYSYSGTQGYPYKDTLSIQANTNVQPWLIYDPYLPAATVLNSPIEFYGPGSWSSQGASSGQKTGISSKKKTNRRIRW